MTIKNLFKIFPGEKFKYIFKAIGGERDENGIKDDSDRGYDAFLNILISVSSFVALNVLFFHPEQINNIIDMINQGKEISNSELQKTLLGISGKGGSINLLAKVFVAGLPVSMFINNMKKLFSLSNEYRLKEDTNYRIEKINQLSKKINQLPDKKLRDYLKNEMSIIKQTKSDVNYLKKIVEIVDDIEKLNNGKEIPSSFIERNSSILKSNNTINSLIEILEKYKKELENERYLDKCINDNKKNYGMGVGY